MELAEGLLRTGAAVSKYPAESPDIHSMSSTHVHGSRPVKASQSSWPQT